MPKLIFSGFGVSGGDCIFHKKSVHPQFDFEAHFVTLHSITVASKVSLSQQMPVQFYNWELVRGLFDHFALVLT